MKNLTQFIFFMPLKSMEIIRMFSQSDFATRHMLLNSAQKTSQLRR